MIQSDRPTSLALRVRRLARDLVHSDAVQRSIAMVAVTRRRTRQRLQDKFVRGPWLTTDRYLAANPPSVRPRTLFPASRTVISAPTFVPRAPRTQIGGEIGIKVPPRRLGVLEDIWVLGTGGAIVGRDRRLIWDLSYEWPGKPHCHSAYDFSQPQTGRLRGTTATLAAMAADTNYFHFLLNSVARLAYLKNDSAFAAADRVLVSGPVSPLVLDTFRFFGISPDRLFALERGTGYRVDRLIAPPLVQHPFVVPAHVCEFLRAAAGTPAAAGRRRRILIDRSDAPTRRIQNLDALRPLLAAARVEICRLAELAFPRQVELFRDAELVIANHGAALANLVFCAPGTRVLQILAPGMMEREYRTISQHGGLKHDYVVAEFATAQDAALPRKQRDIYLAPAILGEVLAAEGWLA